MQNPRRWSSFLVIVSAFFSFLEPSAKATAESPENNATVRVEQFVPQGSNKKVRQARARFSVPMVAFGDRHRAGLAPFKVTCSVNGKGRWEDPRTWVYDFDHELPGGSHCEFKGTGEWKSAEGATWSGQEQFAFNTGGISVIEFSPNAQSRIDEDQAFLLKLDAVPDLKSLGSGVYLNVDGIQEPIPVEVVEGEVRNQVLKQRKWFWSGLSDRQVVLIKPKRNFPPNAKLKLHWTIAVRSEEGVPADQNQSSEYQVREPFRLEVECERENEASGCIPFLPIRVSGNHSMSISEAKQFRIHVKGSSQEWKPDFENQIEEGGEGKTIRSIKFKGPFPEKAELVVEAPAGLKDEDQRALENAKNFPVTLKTGIAPPLLKFPGHFGILEWDGKEAILPVAYRSIEPSLDSRVIHWGPDPERVSGSIATLPIQNTKEWIKWVSQVGRQDSMEFRTRSIFEKNDFPGRPGSITFPRVADGKPLEVVGVPIRSPGLYVIETQSPNLSAALLGPPSVPKTQSQMFVSTAVLVTDLAVHFKTGPESSLVWVTQLSTGKAVEGAEVSIRDCEGRTVASGKSNVDGVLIVAKSLGAPARCERNNDGMWSLFSDFMSGWIVSAQKGNDWSVVSSRWDKGIRPWNFKLDQVWGWKENSILASTVLDRGLYRAGETLEMKHFFRQHGIKGIQSSNLSQFYKFAEIQNLETGDPVASLEIDWDHLETAVSTWTIPKGAKRGYYAISLVGSPSGDKKALPKGQRRVEPIQTAFFRVADFKIPFSKGGIRLPPHLVLGEKLQADINIDYLNGGAASSLPYEIKVKSSDAPEQPRGDRWKDFTFSRGKVEGEDRSSREESEEGGDEGEVAHAQELGATDPNLIFNQSALLDANGTARIEVASNKFQLKGDRAKVLRVEANYRDPNGDYRTVVNSVPIYPSLVRAGVHLKTSFQARGQVPFTVAVTDLNGKPLADESIAVQWIKQENFSHRKKLIGGFYAYEYKSQLKNSGSACSGKTNSLGLLECQAEQKTPGHYFLEVSAADAQGRKDFTSDSLWIHGSDLDRFDSEDHDRIDLIADRVQYEVGQTAKIEVKMPFSEGTALVSVEREGVLRAFSVPITAKNPVVEVPVRPEDSPNVFVSVLVVRGRVGAPAPTAMVDLAKPAFRMGIVGLKVDWAPHTLKVDVKSDRDSYAIRQKASVDIQVHQADGKSLAKDSEVLIAVVDEGLLQLQENRTWKLLESMMGARPDRVETSTAQMQVIGKRHYGLKAKDPGGDGGVSSAREVFDTLVFFKARAKTDSAGKVHVEFPVKDSLSSFRVVAVAHAGLDRFGTGFTSFRTTQDFSISSSVPAFARVGDQFPAEAVIRNSTQATKKLQVSLQIGGGGSSLVQEIEVKPGQSERVSFPYTVTEGEGARSTLWTLTSAGKKLDQVKAGFQVLPRVEIHVEQSLFEQVSASGLHFPVRPPEGAVPGRSRLELQMSSRLAEPALAGVSDYMVHYPYSCFEQRLSKAVSLDDKKGWEKLISEAGTYTDGQGLLRYFPSDENGHGSVMLTVETLRLLSEKNWEIPRLVRERWLSGLQKFVEGKLPSVYETSGPEATLVKLAAIEALSRYGEFELHLIPTLNLPVGLLPLSAQLDLALLGRRMPLSPHAALFEHARTALQARVSYRGSLLQFESEASESSLHELNTPDSVAARLVLWSLIDSKWESERGRLMRGFVVRARKNGSWDSTTANAWAVLAAKRFSSVVEKTSVEGQTTVALGERADHFTWKNGAAHPPLKSWSLSEAAREKGEPLSVKQAGSGSPWVLAQLFSAIPRTQPVSAGLKLTKRWSSEADQKTGSMSEVELEFESDRDQTWVVIRDPIPGGGAVLGSGLGGDVPGSGTKVLSDSGDRWNGPELAFEERIQSEYRAYFSYIPKGKFKIRYQLRWNQSGHFYVPESRIEAMYAPEIYGEVPGSEVTIRESK